jgi:hypothetical protein
VAFATSKEQKMKFRRSLIAAALVATFAAGTSAAYLDQDVYNNARHPLTALKADDACRTLSGTESR